jgi:hypothetical protein
LLVKTVEIIEKLKQTREDMAGMTTEMTDENTGERFTEELELKREEVPVKTVEKIVEKMEDVREEPEGPG